MELAAWCDLMNVQLPAALVNALRAPSAAPGAATAQSQIPISMPAWVPLPIASPCSKPAKAPRGRPRGGSGNHDALVRRGTELLLEEAGKGHHMTLRQIAKVLHSEPVGASMAGNSIVRRMKGQLPVEQAKETAAQAQARAQAAAKP